MKAPDFLDAENHPTTIFKGDEIDVLSKNEFSVTGDLTIRGVARRATLDVNYLGQWGTPILGGRGGPGVEDPGGLRGDDHD